MSKALKPEISSCVFIIMLLFMVVGFLLFGNPVLHLNEKHLKESISQIDKKVMNEEILLNEIVPFLWEEAYIFGAYTSKEEIEETIGFTHADITDNVINEGVNCVVFVKGNDVVAVINGYSSSLGYEISFDEKISYEDNVKCKVSDNGEYLVIKQI